MVSPDEVKTLQKSHPCSEVDEDPLNLNMEDNSSKKVEDVSCDFVNRSEDTSDISNGNVNEDELILDDIDIKHEFF